MTAYIDIHTHILWNVDDGPKSFVESAAMLRLADAEGTRHIIATPHYIGAGSVSPAKIVARTAELNTWAQQNNLSVRVYTGNEILADADTIRAILSKDALTLAGSRYVLLEFSEAISKTAVLQMTATLIEQGYIPIIAHAVRSFQGQGAFSFLQKLFESGVLLSINSDSLFYFRHPSRALLARKLLRAGFIFSIASDCHHINTRSPRLARAARLVARLAGPACAKTVLYDNPLKILQDADMI